MKLYKVSQYTKKVTDDLDEVTTTTSEHYYHDKKAARKEYYKMKKHYLSCKPESFEEHKYFSGDFEDFWDVEVFLRESCITYVTSISVIETQD